jgi:predicted Zn-dependent protease with MMP-like domain
MSGLFARAASADDIGTLACRALERIPPQFAEHLGDVVFQVEEFADDALLAELGLDDPLELSGVYEGVPLHLRSVSDSGRMPDRIRLFRAAILEEWTARGDVSLEALVAHVVIHEVGHHFGLSDETMHALEEAAAREQDER